MGPSETIKVRQKKLGAATRDAYGKALVELGRTNRDVVVLDADLSKSTKTGLFAKEFPDRFINCGIQEANMVGIASGLAASGKIPFISSFACFLTCKGYEQLRVSVAFSERNVKVVASHGGISVGEDGASQQSIEDFALMNSLPAFVVMCPADEYSTHALVLESARREGPVYIRCGRPKAPIIYASDTTFQIGKGKVLCEGHDVTIIACGLMVFEALVASDLLHAKGIHATVIDMHTIKPLDDMRVEQYARKTGAIVTCEEHTLYGGLSSVVSLSLSTSFPVPHETVAIRDTYAESGKPEELLERYGLTSSHIVKAAEKAVLRKKDL